MPDGLTSIGSCVAAELSCYFQLMEAGDPALFQQWIAQWSDLIEFEVVPVTSGLDTAAALAGLLDQG